MKDRKKKVSASRCASCKQDSTHKLCVSAEGRASRGCPTVCAQDVLHKANEHYNAPEVREFARQASIQEASCYANRDQRPYVVQPCKTRVVEIAEFANRMGYKRLGLAFCIGLAREAEVVEDIFRSRGFEVVSVACKAGRTLKEFLGINDKDKIFRGTEEAMCNPLFQAELLNDQNTDFKILLGLCVGHDSLFFKYSKAPSTVLAVKDRVTGHNPLAAIYLMHSYYRRVKYPNLCSRLSLVGKES